MAPGRRSARSQVSGNCLGYAVASLADDTLLFLGDDFAQADIRHD